MCSPLVGEINHTTTYTNNSFEQIMLVLPKVKKLSNLTDDQIMALNTRIMFTEIDYNYVKNQRKIRNNPNAI